MLTTIFIVVFVWAQCIPVVLIAMDVRWGVRRDWRYWGMAVSWPTWVIPMGVYFIIVATPELKVSPISRLTRPKQGDSK